MKKYWLVFTTTIKEYFVYRLNFALWRLRVFISFCITFFLWQAVLENRSSFGSLNKGYLLSYILFANLLSNFVLGTRTVDIAGEIINGDIINRLLKPISFFKYYLTRDLADKLLNLCFVIIELTILIFLFKPPLQIHLTSNHLFLTAVFLLIGTLISFFFSLIISFIGFWSNEVWSPRFLFLVLVFFLSGTYFPLDILPKPIYYLLLATPFPYLFYLPTQALLGQLTIVNYQLAIISFFWFIILWRLTEYLWKKGNREFSFWGR